MDKGFKFSNKYYISPLSKGELKLILGEYNLTGLAEVVELEGGVMGRVYKISVNGNSYVLKKINPIILGSRKKQHEFVNYLRSQNIKAYEYLDNTNNEIMWSNDGNFYEMTRFIDGNKYDFSEEKDISSIDNLVNLYFVSKEYSAKHKGNNIKPPKQKVESSLSNLHDKFNLWQKWLDVDLNPIVTLIDEFMCSDYFKKLEGGFSYQWVHGDYNPANLLFDTRNNLVGIVDFDRTEPNHFLIDLLVYLFHANLRPASKIRLENEESFLDAGKLDIDIMIFLKGQYEKGIGKINNRDVNFFIGYGFYYVIKRNIWRLIQSVQEKEHLDIKKLKLYQENILSQHGCYKEFVANF
jgi:thiamine kinase-like enzyme